MSKHTPGPWIISDSSEVVAENGRSKIGVIYSDADRCLVAAAPELLEACKLALTSCDPHSEVARMMKAAIAKAEGR